MTEFDSLQAAAVRRVMAWAYEGVIESPQWNGHQFEVIGTQPRGGLLSQGFKTAKLLSETRRTAMTLGISANGDLPDLDQFSRLMADREFARAFRDSALDGIDLLTNDEQHALLRDIETTRTAGRASRTLDTDLARLAEAIDARTIEGIEADLQRISEQVRAQPMPSHPNELHQAPTRESPPHAEGTAFAAEIPTTRRLEAEPTPPNRWRRLTAALNRAVQAAVRWVSGSGAESPTAPAPASGTQPSPARAMRATPEPSMATPAVTIARAEANVTTGRETADATRESTRVARPSDRSDAAVGMLVQLAIDGTPEPSLYPELQRPGTLRAVRGEIVAALRDASVAIGGDGDLVQNLLEHPGVRTQAPQAWAAFVMSAGQVNYNGRRSTFTPAQMLDAMLQRGPLREHVATSLNPAYLSQFPRRIIADVQAATEALASRSDLPALQQVAATVAESAATAQEMRASLQVAVVPATRVISVEQGR